MTIDITKIRNATNDELHMELSLINKELCNRENPTSIER